MSFLNDVVKDIGNEYASIVSDGIAAGDVSNFIDTCLLYTSPSPRDQRGSRMPSSA